MVVVTERECEVEGGRDGEKVRVKERDLRMNEVRFLIRSYLSEGWTAKMKTYDLMANNCLHKMTMSSITLSILKANMARELQWK